MTAWTTPALRGERITLRPLALEDVDPLWALVQEPEGRRLTGTHHEFTRGEIGAYVATRAEQDDRLSFAIADPATGVFLGELVLLDHDEQNRSANLRIALAAVAQGGGRGTEALRLILAYAFDRLGLNRVGLDVFAFNARAIHVYERIGFRHEGRVRDALWWDGEPHDSLLMEILAPEWAVQQEQPGGQ